MYFKLYLGNFKLSLISNLPNFDRIVAVLSQLTSYVNIDIIKCTSTAPDSSESIMDGPLGAMLSQCLDAWSIVLSDPLLAGSSAALSEEEVWLASRLRGGFRDLCGQMFRALFDSLIAVAVQDTLRDQDEEVDVENDEIAERYTVFLCHKYTLRLD